MNKKINLSSNLGVDFMVREYGIKKTTKHIVNELGKIIITLNSLRYDYLEETYISGDEEYLIELINNNSAWLFDSRTFLYGYSALPEDIHISNIAMMRLALINSKGSIEAIREAAKI